MKTRIIINRIACIFLILLISFTMGFSSIGIAFAGTYDNATGTITADEGVNVRAGAGTTYDIVISIPKGTEVDVTADKKGDDGYTWYKIKYEGQTGYVRSDLISVEKNSGSSDNSGSSSDSGSSNDSGSSSSKPDYSNTFGIIDSGSGVNMRSDAGTSYDVVVGLADGTEVAVTGEKKDSDGNVWYKVKYDGQTGYVRSDLIRIYDNSSESSSGATVMSNKEFDQYIKDQGFPSDYRALLKALHKVHPTWIFQAAHTGLDWSSVLAKESVVGRSLVASSYPDYYKSKASGAYNKETGRYTSFDSGGWNSASEDLIAYYLDPRNFLTSDGIFQFIDHNYDSSTQTLSGIKGVVKGTFLDASYEKQDGEDSSYKTYAEVLRAAGKKSGVNPYVLASMIIVEQGTNGRGGCISGTVKGYEGYFNYFNIGAYKSGNMSAVTRGVWYASKSGDYGRPWDTRAKSIIGGAKFYYQNYVKQKKDTQYFKKWNVMNGSVNVGIGQYMTNVMGAELEAYQLKKAYAGVMNYNLIFKIPVYKDMPEYPCEKPSKKTSILGATISGVSSKTYTGKDISVTPKVKLDGKELKAESDYTVSLENNLDVGTAKVVIRGKGEYKDTISKTFKIRPLGTSITYATAESDHIKVHWEQQSKKMSSDRIKGYQVQLASDKEFKDIIKSVTVSGYDTLSEKIPLNAKAGKTYHVRIRTVAKSGSSKYYSAWSEQTSVKYVKPEDRKSVSKVKVTGLVNKSYNGKARTCDITVTLKDKTLKKNRDYIVKYSNNINVGTATVKITGIGSYKGSVEKTFKIRPKGTAIKSATSDPNNGTITVKWKRQAAKMSKSRIRGYQIYVSTSKSFTKDTTRKFKYKGYKTVEKTIGKIKAGTTYYVKIRTYKKVNGRTYYSYWSKVKKVKA